MTSGAGRSLTWDQENRVTSVATGGQTTSYLYDDGGRRIQKSGPQGTTQYFDMLVERVNGGLIKYYQAGSILVARKDASGTNWYHADRLGSIKLMTDSSGQQLKTYDYDAYGQTIGSSGNAANERGFTGHISDSESDLVYMQARYYDAVLCRFISADTIVPNPINPQAFNRYSYVYNNPISNTDPTGHAPVVVALVTAVSVSASTAPAWVAAVAWIGSGVSIAGYFTEDPLLSTIGGVMLGFAGGFAAPAGGGSIAGLGGGAFGATVAAASSPLSPLDPSEKQAVGWAFTAIGVISGNESVLRYGTKQVFRQVAGEIAEELDISLDDLNTALLIASFAGNIIAGSRYEGPSGDNGDIEMIAGFTGKSARNSGGLLGNDPGLIGVAFDVVDTMLAYQGILTATGVDYIVNGTHSLHLAGFSLGAADVNNIGSFGLGGVTNTAVALPFGNAGVSGVTTIIGAQDPINGFSAGRISTPTALRDLQVNESNPHSREAYEYFRNAGID